MAVDITKASCGGSHVSWSLESEGWVYSNMSGSLTYAIGVGSYPTMTRIVHSSYKVKVCW